ncbi:NAD-dependent epimerase/dehydratase family protein [Algoriphagus boritolerans]|uniref:NAD-dependent epimerase/dehydratase family protein n=1 Tax=Algoriphagus boritolerans TaxID=308111 RepID=UPI002FCDE2DC
MIRKFHDANKNHSSVQIWSTGSPLREFPHGDDFADALYFELNSKLDVHLFKILDQHLN